MKLRDLERNGLKIIRNWWIEILIIIFILVIILIWAGYLEISVLILVVILVSILIQAGYKHRATGRWPDWTGFGEYISPIVVQSNQTFRHGKTFWDLMQLLIIPVILAGGAYWLNESARQSEQSIADQRAQIERNISSDNIQEAALQTYLDKMTELLLKDNLRESKDGEAVRDLARARTLTILKRLDNERKGALLRFLYEANLIQKDKIVIDLNQADLSGANLREADLSQADLSGADLFEANLSGAYLNAAYLSGVDLSETNLSGAKLREANLSGAKLREANLSMADLSRADLSMADLRRANLNEADLFVANLSRANLWRANLSLAKLREAKLSRADLSETNLSMVYLSMAEYNQHTIWPSSFDPSAAGAKLINDLIPTSIPTLTSTFGGLYEPSQQYYLIPTPIPTLTSTPLEFVLMPAGEFDMGSPSSDADSSDSERPIHNVKLTNAFYIGKYEITQKQWREIMGTNPSYIKGDDLPVENVSWNDAQEFIKKLNEKENTSKYRLPSEVEWEYAARAGTTTRYSFGDDESKLGEYAWYDANSKDMTHPVGQKRPNLWDLYDMHGNVWEWVQDSYHGNYDGAPTDGSAWESGSVADRVARGGSWSDAPRYCRSAMRADRDPGRRNGYLGFRLVRDL